MGDPIASRLNLQFRHLPVLLIPLHRRGHLLQVRSTEAARQHVRQQRGASDTSRVRQAAAPKRYSKSAWQGTYEQADPGTLSISGSYRQEHGQSDESWARQDVIACRCERYAKMTIDNDESGD